MYSVNSNSGVVHPMVHDHPISGRRSVYLHLGMTGAVVEAVEGGSIRALEAHEMTSLFNQCVCPGLRVRVYGLGLGFGI